MEDYIKTLKNKKEITILFLCAGNIVRSPAAEMLLELELQKKYGQTRIRAISGATTYFNEVIMDFTKDYLIKEGVSQDRIYQFFPRNVKKYPELLEKADLIIGMENTHIRLLPKEYRAKGSTLAMLAIGEKVNIPDPWGDDIGSYLEVFNVVKEYIEKLVEKFEEWGLVP